ncbi:ankyrin repeat domain-containing protein, partial [Oleiphilus sp. HI0061]
LMILFIAGMLIASCSVISGNDEQTEAILSRLDLSPQKVPAKTPMMLAAERGDSSALKKAFSQGGKLNAMAPEGTAFSLALSNGHASISRILLTAGSQWQEGFSLGDSSALIEAADQGFDQIVKMLIVRGVSLDHRDKEGYTALAKAAIKGHLTTLKILINAGAQVDAYPLGRSVLMHVVEDNNMLISQQLIAVGADLNYQDDDGDTALKIARRKGFFDIDLMLVQAGARP